MEWFAIYGVEVGGDVFDGRFSGGIRVHGLSVTGEETSTWGEREWGDEFLNSNESLKYNGWEEAMGWSIWSTHLPSPRGRLLTSEHTGRVGHCPFFIPLWIL